MRSVYLHLRVANAMAAEALKKGECCYFGDFGVSFAATVVARYSVNNNILFLAIGDIRAYVALVSGHIS